jgi:flavin-dependent thymidylate synthase
MNKNKIQLLGYYGNDEVIACSAWTSTSRDLTDEKKARIPKLIEHLWMAGHETPFEKGMVHFLVDTEIASHIHLLKHRISSMNGESARYKELKEDKYYLPEDFDIKIKSMDSNYFIADYFSEQEINPTWKEMLESYTELGNKMYHQCLEELTPILGRKRAKESARFFKTYNSQIEADISFNMRSFANFIKLRNSEHAQLEIREIAQEMWNLVSNIEGNPFKETLNVINKRINNE